MPTGKNRFDELYRIIETVSHCRYRAQKRLNLHNWLTQITLTGLAFALIVIPLLALGGFNRNFSKTYVEVMQIVFAVAVLAYSLLLSTGNFAVRAERMHASGLKLTRMLRRMYPLMGRTDNAANQKYDALVMEYYDVLEGNENHVHLDFQGTQMAFLRKTGAPTATPEQSKMERSMAFLGYWRRRLELRLSIAFHSFVLFGHYFIALLAVFAWTVLMCIKHKCQ
jgi:hypothetical protein